MIVSRAFLLTWVMRLFPPLLFNRIWVKRIDPTFKEIEVTIFKSRLNKNYHGSIFGGSIFSAADPFYLIMYWENMRKKNITTRNWLKGAVIDYQKPGFTSLSLLFKLTDKDINEAETILLSKGKFIKTHTVQALNTKGDVCATIKIEVYMRNTGIKKEINKA